MKEELDDPDHDVIFVNRRGIFVTYHTYCFCKIMNYFCETITERHHFDHMLIAAIASCWRARNDML